MTFKHFAFLLAALVLFAACRTGKETASVATGKPSETKKTAIDPKKERPADLTERPALDDPPPPGAKPKDADQEQMGKSVLNKWVADANQGQTLAVNVQKGGGILDLGLVSQPYMDPPAAKPGRVVVDLCVNKDGSVSSAKYQSAGSTSRSRVLMNYALDYAKGCRFQESFADKTCGSLTFSFE